MKSRLVFFIAIFLSFQFAGFAEEPVLKITSSAFQNNGMIPKKYTCRGESSSPPLEISGIPQKAQVVALIMDDPDAGGGRTWVHWVVFDIVVPVDKKITIEENTGQFGRIGKNSWGESTFGSPCPPSGQHRYFFKAYALDQPIDLEQGADKSEVEVAMQGHIIGQAELVGLYQNERETRSAAAANDSAAVI